MALTTDITATYRGPGAVMRRLLAMGQNEARALAFLMGACCVMFIAQWPRLAREAHLEGTELNMLLGASLMGLMFIAPLLFYLLAFVSHLVARLMRGQGTGYGARLALFWSLLAASPLILLHGLVAGFIGPGLELQIVGVVWFGVFLWFWLRALIVAESGEAPA
ncbi:YIP1 family protein [Aestuariicoccus sp. MJ-SS9]|uniref:YIP1 family protein n=1 Tax=Aestuariicoccus sp. MJ-SS9 TaxID=3079855 RepID=UPI002912280C|nr:YIP1 family protein [Aestuariicoccus sp. MJ-SS9]MDU8911020.1 YIP1 family protein [Aestuariicoccus sp. MJ-SS9]